MIGLPAFLRLVSRHESNPLSVYRPRQVTRWWPHLVSALGVHPHEHWARLSSARSSRICARRTRLRPVQLVIARTTYNPPLYENLKMNRSILTLCLMLALSLTA